MSEEESINKIARQIEALLANDMPYDVTLDDDELRGKIRRNKSFLLEGLKKGVSEERILRTVRHPPFWEDDIDAGKVWITGPNTGKGIGIAKLSKEYWKDLGEFENIYDVPYLKGILTLPEIDDETRERIIKQIDMLSSTTPILQLSEVMSKTYTVQDQKQESKQMIIVRWDEIDSGDYYGETQFCESWEEAVEYMKKQGKKIYEIEIEDSSDRNA